MTFLLFGILRFFYHFKQYSFSEIGKAGCVLFICLFSIKISAQKVVVSKEINVKNNYAYDIFPDINRNIIFYHDRGQEHLLEIYDENLTFQHSSEINFPDKNVDIISVEKADSILNVFFHWKEPPFFHLAKMSIDQNGKQLDSISIVFSLESVIPPKFRHVTSDDGSKLAIFWVENKFFNYMVLSNKNQCEIIEAGKIENKNFNFKTDFMGIILTNQGNIFLLGQKARSWNNLSEESFMLLAIENQEYNLQYLRAKNYLISQLKMKYDEKNKKLCFAGLLSKNVEDAAVGYFTYSLTGKETDIELFVNEQLFSLEFIGEVYGKKTTKIKKINDIFLENMILREDGGSLLVLEIKKEFLRRAGSGGITRFGDVYNGRGYIDYYNEDIIVLALHADGSEFWKKILYKKQFSQDDNAMYSSCFLFLTPTRLKFVYNDEIKSNNTVSEYVIDPLGNVERKSVLNTQYQNLKLRFKDAIQTSGNTMIVPSEYINKVNLVRIEYPN
ncbi:MAG: hypothetical protein IPN79_06585 [Saprospiraceae bacterium]|nr:hypothetical protein [Saprospiraceae bacterium]